MFKTQPTKRWRKVRLLTTSGVREEPSIAAAARSLGIPARRLMWWIRSGKAPEGLRIEVAPGHPATWCRPSRKGPGRRLSDSERLACARAHGTGGVRITYQDGSFDEYPSAPACSERAGIPLDCLRRWLAGSKPRNERYRGWKFQWF